MKHWTKVIIWLSLGALTASAGALGADDDASGPKDSPACSERKFNPLRERLGLSDEQAAKLKSVFEGERKAAAPLHDALRVNLEKLRWQVDAKAGSKDIAATLNLVEAIRKALNDAHDKVTASLAAILTPEQRARMLLDRYGPGWRHGMIPPEMGDPSHESRGFHERAGGPPPEDEGPQEQDGHPEE
jgi:Spy/CpxP family protein refolding chaperone